MQHHSMQNANCSEHCAAAYLREVVSPLPHTKRGLTETVAKPLSGSFASCGQKAIRIVSGVSLVTHQQLQQHLPKAGFTQQLKIDRCSLEPRALQGSCCACTERGRRAAAPAQSRLPCAQESDRAAGWPRSRCARISAPLHTVLLQSHSECLRAENQEPLQSGLHNASTTAIRAFRRDMRAGA